MWWEYQYDYLGQLTNAVRKWADGTLALGQQFAYSYDGIGNRLWAKRDGRQSDYVVNNLFQYTSRSVPGYVNILGSAHSAATVTVNHSATSRKGEYYRAELAVANGSGPVWLAVTNVGVRGQGTNPDVVTVVTGRLYVARTPEVYTYDADGNLTSDGQWTNRWDGENRLVEQETLPAAYNAGVPRQKLVYGYDWQGRRVSKVVSNWVNNGWQLASDQRFLYEGWNLMAVWDGVSGALQAAFVWGTDLSGTMQGAGGVGGLLAVMIPSGTNAGVYFPVYDGNGNVMGYVRASDGVMVAQYEYGPFGELLRATGPLAKDFNHLFSTKYHDWETGLSYYGHRYYNPPTGRWPNRDPLGELGGTNLYGFIHNNPINRFDPFGLKDYKKGTDDPTIKPDAGAGAWDSEEWTWSNVALKQLIVNNIGIVWVGMPDAVNHIQHYFGNSGSDYTIRLQKMIDDVPSAKNVYNSELALAQAFVESLPDGKHSITSGSPSGGYNRKDESWNWFYAVGGYSAWGKGNATVCKDEYTLEFQYKFYDRYNWDGGKQVTILGQVVTDQFMGEFHRQGLAREFDMFGSVKKTVKWKKGQAPKVTEGWDSEKGGR